MHALRDPSKAKALESTLWEIETLKRHHTPAVSKLASAILKKCNAKVARAAVPLAQQKPEDDMEMNLQDFVKVSYEKLFKEEINRRPWKKQRKKDGVQKASISVAYYNDETAPSSLFTPIEGEDWSAFALPAS